jgi:hypothetical protein
VIERGGQVEVRVCEINARVTGATYPSVLARHFRPHGAWLMRNLRFRSVLDAGQLLGAMRTADCLFTPDRRWGVLPINFNPDEQGRIHKGQFLCLGDNVDQCKEALELAASVLPVSWSYDRD